MNRIRDFGAREQAWWLGGVATTRWRIVVAMTLAMFAGREDTLGAPWWSFFGILLAAVLVISWSDFRTSRPQPPHEGP